jgi:hypothetical protein
MSTDESKQHHVIQWDWFRKSHFKHEYEIGFFGKCLGVTLSWRGEQDPHVTFSTVEEDDGTWCVQSGGNVSSHWIPDMLEQLRLAHQWCEDNCVKEKYGYVFKGRLSQEFTE